MAEVVLALRERLLFQATCSICLELFREPVLTACGHSFCGQCMAGVMGDPPHRSPCPQCRAPVEPGSLRPNRALGDLAEVVRSLEEVGAGPRCPQHGKPLALFCEPCAALLCAPCRDEPEHRRHRVRPAEEAARDLRKTLERNLLSLQEEKEKLKSRGDQKSEDLQKAVMWELQRVPKTLRSCSSTWRIRRRPCWPSWSRCPRSWSIRLMNTHPGFWRGSRCWTRCLLRSRRSRTSRQSSSSCCEAAKAPIPEPVSPELQKSIQSLSEKSQWVVDMVAEFKVNLWREIDWDIKEQVTLDPRTAHPRLILSRDRKRVWVRSEGQNLPDTPKRFTCSCSVLGTQGFTSGRHYWEVEVGKGVCWAVGVALESVPRKEPLHLHRSEKVWRLRLDEDGQYRAVSMTSEVLTLREKLQRIRVCLDYEMGRVTFYNTKDMTQILQFEAIFTEKVFPYFWVCSGDTVIWVCD